MLGKIKLLLKSHKFSVFAILLAVVVSLFYGISSERKKEVNQPLEKPSEIPAVSSEGVVPGKSTLSDLEKFGEAREVIENPDQTKTYLFGTKTDPEPDRIDIKEGNVIFIQKRPKEGDPLSLKDLISQYGNPNLELYSRLPGLKAFVFLENGIMAIATSDTGVISQLRYFIPTNQEEFGKSWGKDFLTNQPTLPPLYY